MKFEKYIDHTLLKPESTRTQIDQIIDEAKAYNFKSVCVNPTHVKYAAERLADSRGARLYGNRIPIRCVDNCNESI